MSEKNQRDGDNEPSMEEILASIRKIISEDSQDNQTHRGDGGSPQDEGARGEDPPAPDEDDVLELTEEVPEDANEDEVEAASASARSPDGRADGSAADRLDQLDDAPSWLKGPLDDGDPELPPDVVQSDDVQEVSAEEDEAGASDGADALAEPAMAEAEAPVAEDEVHSRAAEARAAADATQEMEEGDGMTSKTSGDAQAPAQRDSLLSEETAQAATASLTELARAASARDFGGNEPKSDADRILEGLVREALRPQLKAWLDENLPGLVERIVREEIRRMARRGEEIAEDEREG